LSEIRLVVLRNNLFVNVYVVIGHVEVVYVENLVRLRIREVPVKVMELHLEATHNLNDVVITCKGHVLKGKIVLFPMI